MKYPLQLIAYENIFVIASMIQEILPYSFFDCWPHKKLNRHHCPMLQSLCLRSYLSFRLIVDNWYESIIHFLNEIYKHLASSDFRISIEKKMEFLFSYKSLIACCCNVLWSLDEEKIRIALIWWHHSSKNSESFISLLTTNQ